MGLLSSIFNGSNLLPITIKIKDKFSYVSYGGYQLFYIVSEDGVIFLYDYNNPTDVYKWTQFTIGVTYEISQKLLIKVKTDN